MAICDSKSCTACGACKIICPKNCIEEYYEKDASWFMEKDESICINCGLCEKVCPVLSTDKLNYPQKAYAAWAKDNDIHFSAASGGVVSALYRYSISENMYIAGVYLDDDFEAHFRLGNDISDIDEFKNSKYTFSYTDNIYKKIYMGLKDENNIFFIGLPCQVAALNNYLRDRKYNGNLITADLVCHGTPPPEYLKQHILNIEHKMKKKVKKCYFRDPEYDTNNFVFTLYENNNTGKAFYKKHSKSFDMYQIGYHNALIYRECCYRCKFARRERAGDLTFGDYHGFGKLSKYTYNRKQVSCLLVNTENGEKFLKKVYEYGILNMYERPVDEPLIYEPQFNFPSVAPEERKRFLMDYYKNNDYDFAAYKAFNKIALRNTLYRISHLREIRIALAGIVPYEIKRKIRLIRGK